MDHNGRAPRRRRLPVSALRLARRLLRDASRTHDSDFLLRRQHQLDLVVTNSRLRSPLRAKNLALPHRPLGNDRSLISCDRQLLTDGAIARARSLTNMWTLRAS